MRKLIFIFFTSFQLFAHAQNKANDLLLISNHQPGIREELNPLNTLSPLKTKHRSIIVRCNPVALTLSGLMLLYQHIVSPQISASCIYTRSCSNFSKQAIQEYGIIKGVFLTADRLMRCQRLCENDFPSYAFTPEGKIEDEPSLYKMKHH